MLIKNVRNITMSKKNEQEKDLVFKRNVLRRLYGEDECNNSEQEKQVTEKIEKHTKLHLPIHGNAVPVKRKVYTVTPPPPDFKSYTQERSEVLNTGSEDNEESDSELEETVKRGRRRRKRKHGQINAPQCTSLGDSKGTCKIPETTEKELMHEDNKLTKNQKRKLKKKKHKEKQKKIKTESASFIYSTECDATEDLSPR